MPDDHPIYQKIDEGTVTTDDFNSLIQEATPESVRDRVRRRTSRNETDRHQDVEGHQQLELPTFADRVQPKRERADNTQMHGRGKAGHRHSARTMRHTMPKRFHEALDFIQAHMGKPREDYRKDLAIFEDKYALATLATKMMSLRNVDRDWLNELRSMIR